MITDILRTSLKESRSNEDEQELETLQEEGLFSALVFLNFSESENAKELKNSTYIY